MSSQPIIGIDVALKELEVAVEGDPTTRQVANDGTGRRRLVHRIQRLSPQLVLLEASGGYEQAILDALWEAEVPVVRVNPRQVRDFAKATGQLAKTDALDAHLLVQFGRKLDVEAQRPPSPVRREIACLQARRQALVAMRVAESNRLKQTPHPVARASLQRTMEFLQAETQVLEELMDELIAGDPELAHQAQVLRSVPGIGPGNVRVLLSMLPELGQASGKELAALLGVAPYNHDSGRKKGQRAIGGGRAEVRSSLYMAVRTARRHNPVIRSFYERLVANGKADKVAMVACIRKLIGILNAMLRTNTPWRPSAALTTA